MEDFANLLHRDYGLRPQGKMAPMSAAKGSGVPPSSRGGGGVDSMSKGKSTSNGGRSRASTSGDDDLFFVPKPASRSSEPTYDDVFGGPPKFSAPKVSPSTIPIYDDFRPPPPPPTSSSSNPLPVFDAPYDDDIFHGVRGTRPSNISYDNVFGGPSSSESPPDDLLGGYNTSQKAKAPSPDTSPTYDDELLPGHSSKRAEPSSFISVDDDARKPAEVDPFGGIQSDPFSNIPPPADDPLDSFSGYQATSNGVADGLDGFDIFSQPSNVKTAENGTSNSTRDFVDAADEKPSYSAYSQREPEEDSDGSSPRKQEQVVGDDYIPAGDFSTSADYSDIHARSSDNSWITIVDVKLVTVPTRMPPPSRPPPTIGYNRKKENQVFEDASDTFYGDDDDAAIQRQKEKEILMMKESEERERERLDKEADEFRERQRRAKERELVERANREARERAAKQARERAERVAVEKALQESRMRQAVEARQRAEEAKQKAEAESKLKADMEAKQKAETEAAKQKADAEAQKKAEMERRTQRAAVEKVNAEARERAAQRAAEARAKEQQQQQQQQQKQQPQQQQQQQYKHQQRPADDLDNFFSARPSSAPRQRTATDFPMPPDRRSSGAPAVKKVSSVSGIDELSNLFDNPDSSFREVDGESAERRKARHDRDQRTQVRARQALEEKHRRDLAVQREQAEKQRASETVDYEIKRWAAGKEGNIRALLSSLQYVLWPEAGWQAVSLTELITGPSVKKVFRKATLCIHPDKVQQKGATVQQKYIAEKVFDILQEAWKKFNSEELF